MTWTLYEFEYSPERERKTGKKGVSIVNGIVQQMKCRQDNLLLFNGIRFPVSKIRRISFKYPFISLRKKKEHNNNNNIYSTAHFWSSLKGHMLKNDEEKKNGKINIWHVRPTLCWVFATNLSVLSSLLWRIDNHSNVNKRKGSRNFLFFNSFFFSFSYFFF